MRGATWVGVALTVVLCVALADAIANPAGTGVVVNGGNKLVGNALNAELGKTS